MQQLFDIHFAAQKNHIGIYPGLDAIKFFKEIDFEAEYGHRKLVLTICSLLSNITHKLQK